MKNISLLVQRNIAVLLLLLFSTLFTTNAQKKRPDNPFVQNLTGCTNPIVGCSLFTNSQNYTCASSFTYTAATNDNNCLTGPSGAYYGCLGSTPNQMWFVFTVQTGGNLYFSFNNSAGRDIDGAIWGPIANGDLANACSTTTNSPISCDYSSSSTIGLSVSNAVAGQKYVMLITNFSNSTTDINITQPSGGSVSYCKVNTTTCVAPTVAVSGGSTINQGQSANIVLTFSGTAPFNYTLSDGQTGTTSTNPLTLSVSPLSTTTYSATSVSNGCGAGTSSGSGTVTVLRTVDLITCLPLEGNINDQIGVNNGSAYTHGGNISYVANRNGAATSALSISNGAYVEFPTNNLLNNTFTHSLWVSPLSLPANGNFNYILSIGGIGQSQELYLENESGVVKWVFRSSTTSGNVDVKYPANITLGQWYHLAIVRTINALQMYVNGILVQSSPASGLASTYSSPSVGRLGTQSSGLVNFFNGKIDDIRLFRGGLNGLEIGSLYNSTINCPAIVGTPLISLTNISDNTLCRNQLETINFQQSEVTSGSTYTVQLSDANGGFSNPTIIGSGTIPPIQIAVPTSLVSSGANYQVRIVNSNTISVNTLPVTILPTATGIISGTTTIEEGQATNLTITFTGTSPWIYSVSDGQNSISYTSSTTTVSQSVSPLTTTTYSLSSVKDNVCGTGTGFGNAVITVNPALQLLACYPFNGNAQDSKGIHSGTISGATLTTDRFGNANSAYNFDGNSYIQLANPGDFINNTYTYSAWVNSTNLPTSGSFNSIIGVSSGQVFGFGYINQPVWAMTSYYNSSVPVYDIHPSSSIGANANAWHHLVAVRSLNQIKLYVDGVLVRTSTTSSNPSSPIYVHSNPNVIFRATLGARPDVTNIEFFNGKIDDVKIYKGILNDTQVKAIYLAEQQCPVVETGGLIIATSLSSNTSCPSGNISVSIATNNIIPSTGNPLKVELSNSSGSFASPVQIGSGTTNSIVCTIPANTAAGNYKIRVVYGTLPNQSISVNSLSIAIAPAVTATISGTTSITSGNAATLTINFTGASPWTYRLSGTATDITTAISPITLNVVPTMTTAYTLLSVSNTCGVGTTSGSAIVTVNILPQLLACYKFDGNAQDSKGTNHGTVNGATLTTDRFGKANAAYDFDGISNYIAIPGSPLAPTEYSYAAWVNTKNLTDYSQTILSIGWIGADQVLALSNTTGTANWNFASYIYYAALPIPQILSTIGIGANKWHFVVATRTLNELKLFIDGQIVGSVSSTGVPPAYSTPIAGAIGARSRADIQFFNGKIDDVKIYSGALSSDDVLLLYNEEQGECSAPCSGIIYSINSGDWNSPTTWSCGRVPDLIDKVLIKAGHNVTVATNNAKAKKLLNNGQILFTNSTAKLTFN
ncbi:MAG: LamG domain-containing protein [Bacteroidota bacterium]